MPNGPEKQKPTKALGEVASPGTMQNEDDEELRVVERPPIDTAETPQARARDIHITVGLFPGVEFAPGEVIDMQPNPVIEDKDPTIQVPAIPIEHFVDVPPHVAEPLEVKVSRFPIDDGATDHIGDVSLESDSKLTSLNRAKAD